MVGISDELEAAQDRLRRLEERRQAEAAAYLSQIEFLESSQFRLASELGEHDRELVAVSTELASLRNTKLFRYSRRLRELYGRLRVTRNLPADKAGSAAPAESVEARTYERWIRMYDTLSPEKAAVIRYRLESSSFRPLVSILLPAYNPDLALFARAIESVENQIYENWELCIVDDGSADPGLLPFIEANTSRDPRIKFIRRSENGHISEALKSAYAISSGEWVCTLDHDDELSENALAMCVLALADAADAAMVYTDEDKIDVAGRRFDPNFKCDFDPVLLMGQNYPCHLSLMRRDLIDRAGGFRGGFDGSQDWDLILRISELVKPEQVLHLPHVLYHWRWHKGSTSASVASKGYAVDAGRRAVEDHLTRKGGVGRVMTNPVTGWQRVKWKLPELAPKVSVITITRDGQYLPRSVDSLMRLTTYEDFELIVADHGSSSYETLDFLRSSDSVIKVVRVEGALNRSALYNRAAAECDGEILCFLGDDCEIISGEWLEELVCQVIQDGTGAAGAKLVYPDGSIQHAGIILGIGGVAGSIYKHFDRLEPGDRGRLHLVQSLSAVSGACMVVRRDVWRQTGGLDEENLPEAFSDVDLCLRIAEAGWRVVWTPFAELVRHETMLPSGGASNSDTGAKEAAYMKRRWETKLRRDPFYSPNLTLAGEDSALAWPPRIDI